MNKQIPDWSAMVKASSAPKGIFSEKMKQDVLIRVEQIQRKRFNRPFFYLIAPVAALMLCLVLLTVVDRLPVTFHPVRSADGGQQTVSHDKIPLQYEPAKELAAIPVTDKAMRGSPLVELPLASVQIKDQHQIGAYGTYLDYTKPGEDGVSYFGFQLLKNTSSVDDKFYEIGYGKLSNVKLQKSDAFGLASFRLEGDCGPERRCAYLIAQDGNAVTAYELTDAPIIYEQDLDGDGVTEVIVSTYEQAIYIYKLLGGQIQSVHVQAALKAGYGDTVTYLPDTLLFQLSNKEETRTYSYAAGADMLKQLGK